MTTDNEPTMNTPLTNEEVRRLADEEYWTGTPADPELTTAPPPTTDIVAEMRAFAERLRMMKLDPYDCITLHEWADHMERLQTRVTQLEAEANPKEAITFVTKEQWENAREDAEQIVARVIQSVLMDMAQRESLDGGDGSEEFEYDVIRDVAESFAREFYPLKFGQFHTIKSQDIRDSFMVACGFSEMPERENK